MSVFIIAEAGVNHNGSLELAKKLVDEAEKAGADCIKFQTFISKNLASKSAKKASYQSKVGENESQLEMLKNLELTFEEFEEIYHYCNEKNIMFLSTGFDFESIEFLDSLGMEKWKVPSGELTNLPYLAKIASLNKPIILSTGMGTIEDIEAAVNVLSEHGGKDISILHCTTEYPAPFEEVNLRAMGTLYNKFRCPIGYSDHTKGVEIPVAAVALGAEIIEKHFTLDSTMEGPDHSSSLEPAQLKTMVDYIRHVEVAMGTGEKTPSESEKKNISVARKSIVANRPIQKGEKFTQENLTVKRPGTGISPMKWYDVIGKEASRDFEEDELIEQ